MNKKLAIIGSGDLGQLVAYHAKTDLHFNVVGFFDDFKATGELVDGIPVLGKLSIIEDLYEGKEFDYLFVAIGYKHFDFRWQVFNRFKGKIPFASIIHSSSFVDQSCSIGEGVLILPGSTLDRNVSIGDNTVLNTGCTVAHDTKVGDNCFLAPGVCLAGFIDIEKDCFLGIGTKVIDNIKIATKVQTGGGAVVTQDLTDAGLYLGVPAKLK